MFKVIALQQGGRLRRIMEIFFGNLEGMNEIITKPGISNSEQILTTSILDVLQNKDINEPEIVSQRSNVQNTDQNELEILSSKSLVQNTDKNEVEMLYPESSVNLLTKRDFIFSNKEDIDMDEFDIVTQNGENKMELKFRHKEIKTLSLVHHKMINKN